MYKPTAIFPIPSSSSSSQTKGLHCFQHCAIFTSHSYYIRWSSLGLREIITENHIYQDIDPLDINSTSCALIAFNTQWDTNTQRISTIKRKRTIDKIITVVYDINDLYQGIISILNSQGESIPLSYQLHISRDSITHNWIIDVDFITGGIEISNLLNVEDYLTFINFKRLKKNPPM